MVDISFILTLAIIVAATLVGSYVRSSRKDRCLASFDGFHITVETKSDRVIWGQMNLKSTGFELIYRSDIQDEKHLETSYILYKNEYADIQAIYRNAQELTEENRKRREKDLRHSFHPAWWRRGWRKLRNFMSTATESLNEAVGLMIVQARKPAAHLISDTGEAYLKDISKNVVGYAGTTYDPLLEQYIGTRVVVEVVEEEAVHEHVGIFKNYSADFLEILDVYYPTPQEVRLQGETQWDIANKVSVITEGRQVRVHNNSEQPVLVERISVGDKEKELSAIIGGNEEIVLHVDNIQAEIVLHMRVACLLDMIVPRGHSLVRHRAERYDPDTIFDVGLALVRLDDDDAEIERLRQALRYTPHDAQSAARLGELLYRDGQLEEAQLWLLRAQEHARQLPDGGRRVAQHLRMLQRQVGVRKGPTRLNGSQAGSVPALASPATAVKANRKQ